MKNFFSKFFNRKTAPAIYPGDPSDLPDDPEKAAINRLIYRLTHENYVSTGESYIAHTYILDAIWNGDGETFSQCLGSFRKKKDRKNFHLLDIMEEKDNLKLIATTVSAKQMESEEISRQNLAIVSLETFDQYLKGNTDKSVEDLILKAAADLRITPASPSPSPPAV